MNIVLNIVVGYILLYLYERLIRLTPLFTSLKKFYRSMLAIGCMSLVFELLVLYDAQMKGLLEAKLLAVIIILTFYQFRVMKTFRRRRVARGVCGWCFTPIDTMMYTCPHCKNDYD